MDASGFIFSWRSVKDQNIPTERSIPKNHPNTTARPSLLIQVENTEKTNRLRYCSFALYHDANTPTTSIRENHSPQQLFVVITKTGADCVIEATMSATLTRMSSERVYLNGGVNTQAQADLQRKNGEQNAPSTRTPEHTGFLESTCPKRLIVSRTPLEKIP